MKEKASQSVHYLIFYIYSSSHCNFNKTSASLVCCTDSKMKWKKRGKKKNLNARQTSMCSVCVYTQIKYTHSWTAWINSHSLIKIGWSWICQKRNLKAFSFARLCKFGVVFDLCFSCCSAEPSLRVLRNVNYNFTLCHNLRQWCASL